MKNLSIEAGIQRLSCIILLFCSLFLSSTQQYLNAQTMSGVNPAAYNEGAAPVVLYPGFTFSGGSNYGGGYMLFDITNGDAQDQLSIFNDPNPNALNAISVVGTGVYLGNGTGTDIIGSIDPVLNGQNGQDLRINFTSNFQNAGFESGMVGWTAVDQNVNLGVTNIGGFVTPETGTYPVNAGNDDVPGSMSYGSGVTNAQFSQGSNSLQIWNNGISGPCDVVHGGYAISDPFQANGGDVLNFDWRAIGGGDAYDVFGYLLNTTTGATTITLDLTGGFTTPWTTANVIVPTNGTYRFVFVSGTYDASCGTVLGATLYLDNFIVANSLVNASIIQLLGQHVTYANTCGTSDVTRNITVSVVNATNVTTSASSTIAINTFNPVITCPGNISLNSPAGQCSAVATYTATATDNCPTTITYSFPSGSSFPVGITPVTATATDSYGNLNSCIFTVTVLDVTPPVINCPTGYTVDVFTNDCVTSVFWAVPTATDNCGFATVTQTGGIAQGSVQAPGVYTVTYVATDGATPPNTSAPCSFNINVVDTENPVIINCPYNAQEITVNANCQATLPNYAATMQASDNCGYTWSQTPAAGGLYLGGAVVAVTVTATDAAGNSSACSFNVNVIDQIDPVVTCPADITDTNDPGQCGAVVTYNLPTITDNCITCTAPTSLPNFTFVGVLLGHTYFRSNYTSTWTAAQAFATSQGAHLATITSAAENTLVVGNGALAWIGLTDQVTEGTWQWVTGEPLVYAAWNPGEPNNAGGNEDYAITNWNVAGLWNDLPNQSHPFLIEFDCAAAVPTQTAGLPSGSTFPVGTTTNTFSFTDIGGNTAECSFDVIITDTELPVISCAGLSAIRTTSSGGTGDCYGEYAWSHPVPTDNCGIAQYHFTYTNPDGTIDGPFDAIQIANGTMSAAANHNFEIGLTTVSYYVEDIHGNTNACSFTVTVTDNEAPVFENCPPAGYTVDVFTNDCITDIMWNVPTATDNCSVTVTQTGGVTYGSQQAPGTYTIVYTASDNATPPNTATCSFTIEIADTENPIIQNCPYNNQEIFVDADCEALLPNYTTTINAFDNCGTYTTTQSPLAGAGPYAAGDVVPVIITVADGNGNSSTCAFDVDVMDDIDPVITCPADITQNIDPGACGALVTFADPTVSDNCPLPVPFVPPVTFTTAGAFGRFGPTQAQADAAYGVGVVTINTQGIQQWIVPTTGTYLISATGAEGGSNQIWSGGLGASMSGEFNLVAGDIIEVIVGQEGEDGYEAGNDAEGCAGAGGSFILRNGTLLLAAGGGGGAGVGEYGINGVPRADNNFGTFGFNANPGIITNSGNTANGNWPYGANGTPGNLGNGGTGGTYFAGGGGAGFLSNGGNTSDGNIAYGGLSYTNGFLGGYSDGYWTTSTDGGFGGGAGAVFGGGGGGGYSGGAGGHHGANFSATGGGGGGSYNSGSNQINIDGSNSGNGLVSFTLINGGADPLVQTDGLPSGSLFPVGTTTNTFVVTDAAGNTAECSFDVVIIDTEVPTVDCSGLTTSINTSVGGTGDCQGQYTWPIPAPEDNCGVINYTVTFTNPDGSIDGPFNAYVYTPENLANGAPTAVRNFDLGTTTVTYYVEDAAGNTGSCFFTVTVTDNEAPTFVNCPPAGFTLDVFTNDCTTSANWSIPVAEDNCEVTVTVNAALNSNYPPVTGPEIVPGVILPPGIYTVAYTATDGAGLTALCSFTINVIDTENPIISNCPFDDLTLEVGADCIGNLPDYTIRINTEDNCGPYTVTQVPAPSAISGITYAVGDIISVVITVEDGSANTSTCEFDVLVQDNSLPTVLCNNIGTGAGSGISFVEDFSDNSAGWTLGPEWEIGTVTNNSCSNWCPNQPNTDNTPTPDNGVAGVALNGGCDLGGVLHPMQWLTSPIIDASGVTGTLMLEYYRWLSSDYLPYRSNYVEIYNGTSWVLLQDLSKYDLSPWCDNAWVFNSIDITAFANANLQVRFGWDVSSNGYYPGDSYNIDDFSIIELDATPEPIYLDEDGFASITVADIDGGSFDNCGIQDISLNITDFNCTHVGSNTVTLTVTDVNGNTASCQSEVVVADSLAPVALCNNLNLILNEFGNVTISEDDVNNGSTDNCAIGNIQLDQTFFDCSDLGQNIVTLTVTDIYGNASTCESTVTVTDNEAPAFVNCPPAGFTLDVFTNDCVTSANWSIPVAEDNCDVTVTIDAALNSNHPVTGFEIMPGDILPLGTYTVAYTATDGAGLTALCSFTINVIDTENPVIINCPYNDQEIFVDADCEAVLPNYATTLQASDNCNYTWAQTPLAGTVFTAGDIVVVTVTATDAAGNFTECTFNVNVIDDIDPVITCPDDISVNNDPGVCGALVTFEHPVISDNCPFPTASIGPLNFTTAGASGISGPTQAQVDAAYAGTELDGQIIVSGQGIQLWTVPVTGTYLINAAGASGGYTPNAPGGKGRSITTEVNLTAGEVLEILVGQEGGRTSQNMFDPTPAYAGGGGGGSFIVNQTTGDPILIAGGGGGAGEGGFDGGSIQPGVDASAYNITSGQSGTGYSGSWDPPSPGGTGGNGGNRTGYGGGSGGGFFTDGLGGDFYGGDPGISYANGGLGGINRLWNGGLLMNIDGGFGGGAGVGTHQNYEANGGAGGGYSGGGASATRIGAGGGGGNYFIGTYISSDDNTGNGFVSITLVGGGANPLVQIEGLPSGSLFPTGTTTNTFVVTDAAGNTATCSFDVTVTDNEDPVVDCTGLSTAITTSASGTGDCEGQYTWAIPNPTDNCGIINYSVTYANPDGTIDGPYNAFVFTAGNPTNLSGPNPDPSLGPPMAIRNFGIGISTVTYYVEDEAGNTSSCSFTVTVTDDEAPEFVVCPPDGYDVDVFTNDCVTDIYWVIPAATDNCSVTVAQTQGPAYGTSVGPGSYFIEYVATDGAALTDTCSFTINVIDTENPVIINCPYNDQEIFVDADCEVALPNYATTLQATDNCGYTWSQTPLAGTVFTAGDIVVVSVTATDGAGNSTTCTFNVNVLDTIPPTIECPADIAVVNDPGVCGAVVTFADPVISDNCPLSGGGGPIIETFGFTNGVQTFTVPPGVTEITINALGAQGGGLNGGGGLGAQIVGIFNVTPGDVLEVIVGEMGQLQVAGSNLNSSGGGGGSFVYNQSGHALMVAAGGGGGKCNYISTLHPEADGQSGLNGGNPSITGGFTPGTPGVGGNGGTGGIVLGRPSSGGGTGWLSSGATAPFAGNGYPIWSGGQGQSAGGGGGTGGRGGFGGGGGGGNDYGGGGGGGGYSGGGGGDDPEHGGGGGSFNGGSGQTNSSGIKMGDGLVTISYSLGASIVQVAGLSSGSLFPVGTTTNTFVLTDNFGNTDICSFDVTVTDTELPVVDCTGLTTAFTTSAGGTGDCEGLYSWTIPTPSDNCGVINYTVAYTNPDGSIDGPFDAYTYSPGNPSNGASTATRNFELGVTTVTYYVEDEAGNTNSCSFTVTVTDDEAPEFVTCPPAGYDVDVFTNDCVTDIYWVIPAATDNCSVTVAQTQGPDYGTSVGPGSYFIEYVATDGAALTDTCSFTINVIDTENPVIINCPYNDQEIFVDDACEVLLPDYAATMQATDNCSYTWAQTPLAGTVFTAKDVVVVTVTATDPSGNSTTCTFNVNVLDTIPPTIECPADIEVSNDLGVCGAQVEYDLPVIGDNCPISIGGMQTFTYNGNAETWTVPAGITQISAQVCGAQGGHVNGGAGACLTVELSVTPGQVLEIYSGGQGSVGGSACAAGEGGEASYIAQGGIPLVVAAGGGGGLQCPGEPSLYGGVGNDGLTTTIGNRNSPFPWGTGGSGGNGGAAGPGSWGTGGGGGWYSTGSNGGGSTGGALLGQPSNFAPYEGYAGGAGGGYNGAGGTGMDGGWGTASGAGGGSYYTGNLVSSAAGAQLMNGMVIISYQSTTLVQIEGLPSGSVFPVGTTTNTFVVTDASGNTAQCSFDVTVTDDEDPVIICPENVTITTSNLGTIGDCTGQYNWDHPLATDNCIIEGYWFVYTNPDGSIDGPYDVSGLVNGPIEVQASHKFDLGITTVTYYAVDPSGNEFTCEFTVTVTDNEFPVWNPLPQDLTLECDGTTDPYNQIQFWLNTNGGGIAYDNCGPVTYSNNYTGYTVGCSQNTHTSMITFTATDPNGNSTSVEVSLTIIDTQAPIITTMARDTIVECDGLGNTADLASWLANHGGAIAEDVCSEPLTWDYTLISTTGTCGGTFTSRYAFRATDACENVSVNTEALFIIVDTTVPQFDVLPQDSIVQCDGVGNTTQLAGWLASNAGLVASDVCNEVVEIRYDLIQETDLCGITGSGLYRFTILDACGNKNFADASFIIVDTIPPAITGGEDMVMEECDDPPAGNYPEFDFWLTNNAGATAEDVCGSFEWSNNFHLDNWIQQCGNTKYVDVTFYATDICGNVDSIIHRFSIGDVTPPVFVNCPRPDIVVDVPTNLCESYVNFSMPYAIDNCGTAVVEQTDTTGLTSGDLFPVGCTILEFTATDDCGNQTVCYLRIIVNDNHTPPVLECPESVETVNDPGFCGAIVDELAPVVTDNCPDHVFVSYTIQDESGEVIGSGVEDASGTEFPVGVNTVTYTAYDQPQFLITEVLQDGMVTGVEIGNFGPAAIDLGCAVVKRTNSTADEEYSQHHGTVVGAGEVHVVQFTPIPEGEVATYSIEFKDRIVDMITINDGLDGVDIFRISAIDTDTNDDFEVVNACTEGSFGLWNPQLPNYADNGIITKMQSVHPNQTSCSFTVTVVDVESPVCGGIDTLSFSAGGMTIGDDLCVSSVFTLPAGKIAKINIVDLIADVQNAGLVTVTLTGPDGTKIVLLENTCAGTSDINVNLDDIAPTNVAFAGCDPLGNGSTFAPMTSMFTFFGAESAGNWTLELYTDAPNSGTLTNWTIEFLLYSVFDQEDIVAENDPGVCGADITWVHPYFLDNCIEGSMTVTYSFNNDVTGESYEITEVVLSSGGSIDLDGMPVTRYFEVGVTTITYTLTDQYGHISYCGFTVTVLDTEAPVFPNGCADFVVTLDPGLCYGNLTVFPEVTDNCALESLIYYYPDGSVVDINQIPIGNNEIWAVATDIYGNADTCIFNFRVIEYIPTNNAIACNDNVSISLDADCHAEITADMVLEGNNYRCYENYCLTITDQYGNIHPNAFDYSDAGQTFMVTVTDCLGGGNSCMSEVTVMEKWVPEIECPEDATVSCNASIDPSVLGVVKILNCEPFATIEYIDEYIDNGICGNPRAIINRNWIVNDHQGNIVNCTQIITIEKSTLAQVVFPKDVLNLSCQYANQNPQAVHPDQTGYPTVDGIGVNINDGLCMFSYLWNDEVYNYCGNSFEILRTWKVRDMCGPVNAQNPRTHVQVIRVFDTTPPEICSCEDYYVNADAFRCEGSIDLPLPCITDDCSQIKSIKVFVSGAAVKITGNYAAGTLKVRVYNMKLGTYPARWVVEDACGNRSSCIFNIVVEDKFPPVAACQQYKQVGITLTGAAKVDAKSFDSGSWDNCKPVWFKVWRGDGGCMDLNCDNTACTQQWFDDDVYFCCEDADKEVMVTLRVFEVDPGPGPVNPNRMLPGGDLYGHFNDCMTTTLVKDKSVPLMACEDVTITCEDNKDPEHTGYPYVLSTCGVYDLEYSDNLSTLNHCGIGYFTRTWQVFVGGEKQGQCNQRIYVTATLPFDPLTIVFPYISQETCLKPEPTGEQTTWTTNPCNIVEASIIKVDTFRFVEDACYKILREWAVIDWCVYKTNTGAESNIDEYRYISNNRRAILDPAKFTEADRDGYYRFTEVIMVYDNQAANIVVTDTCLGVVTCITAQNTHKLYATSYEEDEDCGGEYEWTYVIHSECCDDVVQFSSNNNAYKGANYQGGVSGRSSDDKLKGAVASMLILPSLEIGRYKVTWTLSDGCGNVTTAYQYIDVADKKAPTPYLVDIATATMTENCMVELTAVFFDKGACDNNCLASYDNCSDVLYFTYTPVLPKIDGTWSLDAYGLYYFNPLTGAKSNRSAYLGGTAHSWDPAKQTSGKVFFGPSRTVNVEVYVWDEFGLNEACDDGNYDYATVELRINSEGDVDCPDNFVSVTGFIYNTANEGGINNVEVRADDGSESRYSQTDPSGNFSFVLNEGEYDITPKKRDDYTNGVNTLDLILIQKHILGIEEITGDQLIAADANANGTVTAVDIKQIRDLILGVTTELPKNDSWVFVPSEYSTYIEEPIELRFGGIKVGDVNRSAANNFNGTAVNTRQSNSIELLLDEKVLSKGDEIRLEFRSGNFTDVRGMQFTLYTEGLKYIGFESGKLQLSADNLGRIRDEVTTLSWNESTGLSATEEEVLFTLIFEGQQKTNLSSAVQITSQITPAEGYVADELNTWNVDLEFRGITPDVFELFQNEPNPFAQTTLVRFNLPEAGEYEFSVFDVTGKELMKITGEGKKGLNEEVLKATELKQGMLYYQLKFKDFVANRKMILVK